jgi:hypothetical protein
VSDDGGAELARERGLGLEAGDHEHLDVGVERAEDRGGARTERAGAVHHRLAAGHGRMAGDGVQADGEGVGEDRKLVRDLVRNLEQLGVVGGHERRVPAAGVARRPGVDAGRDRADAEAPAQAEVAGLARRADRVDAARPA